MALQLTSQSQFYSELEQRGFAPTKFAEKGVTIWTHNGNFYTLPLPVFEENGHVLYCPFAIQLFFKHVLGSEAKVPTANHGHADYGVTDADQASEGDKPSA